jgi:uncharacterized membrane protein YkvA (DUF1232 family)
VLIAVLVVAIVFFTRLVRLYAVVRDPRMPTSGKVAFWVAAIYAVFPIDVLPDPVYLDDAGVLAFAVAFVTNLARKHGIRVGQVTSRESGRTTAEHVADVPRRQHRHRLARLVRRGAEVRRQQHVRRVAQPRVHGRLVLEHVEPGTGDPALAQRLGQRGLVDRPDRARC